MKIDATLRHLNIAPRKVRTVVDVVRGLSADEALRQLQFMHKRAARPVRKLIASAVANAEHNFALDPRSLTVVSIQVDGGPVLKRYKPKAFGRVGMIRRRTSHVRVILEGVPTGEVPQVQQKTEQKTERLPDATDTPTSQQKKEKDFEVEKERGRKQEQQKQSFMKRFFQRKSI